MINRTNDDVLKIRSNLSQKDLFYLGTEKDLSNIIYRKVEYINQIPVAFIDVYYFSKYPRAYIALAVLPEYRHKGIAYNMVRELLKTNLPKKYKFNTWVWNVEKDNIASQRLPIKLGFKLSGTSSKGYEYCLNTERVDNTMNTKQEYISTIENAFKVLKENVESEVAIKMLKEASEGIFPGYTFNVKDCYYTSNDDGTNPLYIMAVYPNDASIRKIVNAIIKNESNTVMKLWNETKEWTVEIDARILSNHYSGLDLSDRELTAIYLHELGHIISTNSIPSRLINILQYEVAKASITYKAMVGDKFFRTFLSLPILNACMVDNNKSIKEEIKADKFVCDAGYKKELISAMDKILKSSRVKKNDSRDKALKTMARFSADSLEQFKQRRGELVESTLTEMRDNCASVYLSEKVQELINTFFLKHENEIGSVTREKKLNYFYERADKLVEDYITEFFGFGTKSLERIDPAEIDYIFIKMNSIKTDSDKMMLVSYIHSKLDIVDYYLSIIANPKLSTKYRVPYTVDELRALHDRLNQAINTIINMKINKNEGLLVAWPDNYDD